MRLSSLSIFFPALNEEKNIPIVINQALAVAPKYSNKFEIIVVNDGSVDKTKQVVEEIAKRHKNIKLVNHIKNMGYGAALKSGFYSCKYDFITYMDSDGQFNFGQLERLISKIDNADIVVGYRIKRADKFIRVVNGKLWNFLVSVLLGIYLRDIDCGFKLIKKQVIEKIPKLESNGATISAELLVKAKKNGFKIEQIGLEHEPRRFGNATGGNPLHIFRAFIDLIKLWPKL